MEKYSRRSNVRMTESHDYCEHLQVGAIAPVVEELSDRFGLLSAKGWCHDCAYKKFPYYADHWDSTVQERAEETAWRATFPKEQ